MLVFLTALPGVMDVVAQAGFRLACTWSESRDIEGHHPLLGRPTPSAFVLTHVDVSCRS